MKPFLALITPVGDTGGGEPPRPWGPINYPDQGLPGQPGQPPRPWGPINYPDQGLPQPGQPPRPWGPINYPDQGLPGYQPHPDQGLPGQQPGIWGPIFYPDQGLPGRQPFPGRPTHPIHYPPVIWDPSRPTNPITNPDDPDHPAQGQPKIEWKSAWSPSTGWVVVGVPVGPTVTPSEE